MKDVDGDTIRSGGKEYYSHLDRWERRLGVKLDRLIGPELDIRPVLQELGFDTWAVTSANPVGPGTLFSSLFDRFDYVGRQGDSLLRIVDVLRDEDLRGKFLILNTCETHYPYFDGSSGEDFQTRKVKSWKSRVSRGLAGVGPAESLPVGTEQLSELRDRQCRAVRRVDKSLGELIALLPANSFITVTSDHGDCLGESGEFLHGEVTDPVALRVPFIEGPVS